MIITQILKRRGFLSEVRFDDGTYILLDRKLCEENLLKVGEFCSEEKAVLLEDESDEKRCKNRAMYYLSGGDYSVKGMKEKLKKAGFEERFVNKTVKRLTELNLLDDESFCRRYVERLTEQKLSLKEIKEKVYLKGIHKDILNCVLEETPLDEPKQIMALLEGKYKNKLSNQEDSQKVIAALLRKGFNFSDIREAVRRIQTGEDL